MPAAAEGRHDPFLKCSLGGRVIVLAENGAGTDWVEGADRYPAVNFADRRTEGDTLVTVVAYLPGGVQRLDVFAPLTEPGSGAHPAPLAALLSRTAASGTTLAARSVAGQCEEFHG